MSTQIPDCPPYKFVAGDTVVFTVQNQNFPSTNFTMDCVLFAPSIDPDSFSGVAQTDGSFLVSATPSQTETVLPEQYTVVYVYAPISGPPARKSIIGPIVWVIPDLTQQTNPTPNQILLASLTSAMNSLAAGTIQSATINQQTWTKKNMSELQRQIYVVQAAIKTEMQQLNALLDHPDTNVVGFEFGYMGAYPGYYGPWPGNGRGYGC